MQKLVFLLLFLLSTQLFAQTDSIKGSVFTNDGKVAEFDTIKELTEVVVTAKPSKYVKDYPSVSLRLKTPLLEVPQNIQIITQQIIKDQQIFDMLEGVTRNVSGARRMEHWDNYTLIYMRGSQIAAFRNGMNVTMSWSPQPEDMSMVECIEFVKGPAGFMLANGEPSGFYNVVTKKPTGITKGEVSMTVGSFNTYRTTLDLNGKLDKNGKLLYRLNVLGQSKGSQRPYDYNNRISVAPVLTYKLSDNTTLTAEYTHQKNSMTMIGSNYSFSAKEYNDLPVDFTTAEDNMPPTTLTENSAFITMVHNLDDNWKFTGQIAYINSKQIGESLWPTGFSANKDSLYRSISIWDYEGESKVGQFFVNGDVQTGFFRHRLLGGIDMGDKSFYHDWSQTAALKPLEVYNPVYGQIAVSDYPLFDRSLHIRERGVHYRQSYVGYYAQDEISMLSDKLRLTLAGRFTTANNLDPYAGSIDAAKFTPRVGVSYSIDENSAVYGVYDQAFIPQAGSDKQGNSFKPVTGDNVELGVKREWYGGNWITSLSLYKITKNNMLTADPDNIYFSIQLGQTVTKGVEFDLRGQITDDLNLTANYAYTDGVVTKDTDPANENITIPGITTHLANAWITYRAPKGAMNGLGLSLGAQYQGERTPWSLSSDKTRESLPDYFRLDGAVSYQLNRFTIALNVNNITSKTLYSGGYYDWGGFYYWQSEALINARLSITYKF
jgi:iron complex outermembrane receptor protein